MTPLTTAPTPAPPSASWLRRHRALIGFVVGVVLVIVFVGWVTRDDAAQSAPLDPRNPGKDGAQAVAKVLESQGVDVEIVRDADAFEAAEPDDNTLVVVTSTSSLGATTLSHLLIHSSRSEVLLVAPSPGVLAMFDASNPSPTSTADGACPEWEGLELDVDVERPMPGTDACLGGTLTTATSHGHTARLFGAGDALTNDQVLLGDNAAIALRLLGSHQRVVWYVPSVNDLAPAEGVSLRSLLPAWLFPGLWLALLAMVAVMFWRGRRLGPLAVEPLPVAVKAIETTRSRGRMYRHAGDRGHAAAALRHASRRRAAERLGVGRGADETAVLAAVAAHTGRNLDDVQRLLGSGSPVPASSRDLVALASALTELDREVRRT